MQQQKELKEVLEAAGGFKQVSKAQAGIKARKVIQQTLHLLGLVGKALQPVLTPHSFVQLGAQLLDCVASKITGRPLQRLYRCAKLENYHRQSSDVKHGIPSSTVLPIASDF